MSYVSGSGIDYKFIIYTPDRPIAEVMPGLKTKTSAVYDYAIGVPNNVADKHSCLPIWYGQDEEVTNQVVAELNA